MTPPAADTGRDALAPRRPPGMRLGLALAIGAHVLLILAIAFGVAWKTSEPDGLVAELWAPTVQQAAPRATAPEPTPTPPTPTPTPPQPADPTPPPTPVPPAPRTPPPEPAAAPKGPTEAEIALEKERERQRRERAEAEKERREAAQRERQQEREKERERQRAAQQKEREEQQKRDKAEAEKRRLAEAEKEKRDKAEKAEAAARAKREDQQLAALRDAQTRRAQALAGTGEPSSTGTAARSAGPSAGYAGRIRARVKPNITLTGEVAGNPTAVVEVRAAPDGTITGRRIVQSSGSAVWDETVLRAIDRTEILPKDTDGSVPSPITIAFKPRE
jgi:colicin import membrane protein